MNSKSVNTCMRGRTGVRETGRKGVGERRKGVGERRKGVGERRGRLGEREKVGEKK